MICENYILVFGHCSVEDPCLYGIEQCFLYKEEMPEKVEIRVHPPTAGIGVFCIDGGGVWGIGPLRLMKRIHDSIGLPVPFQRLIWVAFGVSLGTPPSPRSCFGIYVCANRDRQSNHSRYFS